MAVWSFIIKSCKFELNNEQNIVNVNNLLVELDKVMQIQA